MNIKSLFMLGMLSIPTGICGDIPENHMIGSNNGVVNASDNLSEVAPANTHNAQRLLALPLVIETLHQMV